MINYLEQTDIEQVSVIKWSKKRAKQWFENCYSNVIKVTIKTITPM